MPKYLLEASYTLEGTKGLLKIVDVPDHVSATAASLVVNASGAVRVKTTVLITPEEMDQATKRSVSFRAPGQP